jgi:hypothetical protein
MPSPAQTARNRLAGKLRHNPDADVTELRRELRVAQAGVDFTRSFAVLADEYLDGVMADWPPPTPEKVQEIAEILHGGAGE